MGHMEINMVAELEPPGPAPGLLDAALAALRAGLSVHPPMEDGTKAPAPLYRKPEGGSTWLHPPGEPADEATVRAWYGPRRGIGLRCGAEGGGLECFEFDDGTTYRAYKDAAAESGLGDLVARVESGYLETTPGGGVHWLYVAAEVRGNAKLARRPEPTDASPHAVKTLVETKGENGFVIVAPSGGAVHPSGRPYRRTRGGFDSIATLSAEERDALWRLARSFDRMPRPRAEPEPRHGEHRGGLQPGDDFNQRTTWAEILGPAGWTAVFTRGDATCWRRPGKPAGISATTNHAGSGLLYVFTSSTAFDPEKSYTKFGAYSVLRHGGDFAAAARSLRKEGYGAEAPAAPRRDGHVHGHHAAAPLRVVGGGPPPPDGPGRAPGDDDPGDDAGAGERRTDLGNARRLVAMFGHDLRYCHPWKSWLAWAADRWRLDETGLVYRKARAVVARLHFEAEEEGDDAKRKAMWAWALACEGEKRLNAMVSMARHEEGVPVMPADLDAPPWLLNCPNGTVDLRTGTLGPHVRGDLLTRRTNAPFHPDAACPTWEAVLRRIMGGDEEMVAFLRRAVGYALTGIVSEHALFFLYGLGRNGKSTMVNTVQDVMGDYAITVNADLLTAKNTEDHPTGLADLQGRRFVATIEVEDGRKMAESLVKTLTGGDKIRARRMRQDFFEFDPTHKLFLAANHKPVVRGTDDGIWRRIKLIPFKVQIPDAEVDRSLPAKLRAEAPGILAWAVRGCLEWQAVGLREPSAVVEATQDYREEMDVLPEFLSECCETHELYKCRSSAMYRVYADWCRETGSHQSSQNKFGRMLTDRGFPVDKANSQNWRLGIRPKEEALKPASVPNF